MADSDDARPQSELAERLRAISKSVPAEPKTLCERCGVEMFRMHAVWRCPGCGYKTDCCGW